MSHNTGPTLLLDFLPAYTHLKSKNFANFLPTPPNFAFWMSIKWQKKLKTKWLSIVRHPVLMMTADDRTANNTQEYYEIDGVAAEAGAVPVSPWPVSQLGAVPGRHPGHGQAHPQPGKSKSIFKVNHDLCPKHELHIGHCRSPHCTQHIYNYTHSRELRNASVGANTPIYTTPNIFSWYYRISATVFRVISPQKTATIPYFLYL